MPYRFRKRKSVQKSLRKIASEQIDRAIGEIEDDSLDRHETVHQVRKRCKKIRGLIRIVRPVFDQYQSENGFFRDAARELSYVRDAQSMLECFESLLGHYEDQVDESAFRDIHQSLRERRQQVSDDQVNLDRKLEEFYAKMVEARKRIDHWVLDEGGFDALEDGLKKTYRRARKAMEDAYENPSAETFHEWRKRVKYHWYHSRLLRNVWKKAMKVHRKAADDLSDLLGDEHDLAVLRQTILDDPDRFNGDESRQALIGLIDRRRAQLQCRARPVGRRLLAEKPKQLASRIRTYWGVWRDE